MIDGTWSVKNYIKCVFGGQYHKGNYHFSGWTDKHLKQTFEDFGVNVTKIEYIHKNLNIKPYSWNAKLYFIGEKTSKTLIYTNISVDLSISDNKVFVNSSYCIKNFNIQIKKNVTKCINYWFYRTLKC